MFNLADQHNQTADDSQQPCFPGHVIAGRSRVGALLAALLLGLLLIGVATFFAGGVRSASLQEPDPALSPALQEALAQLRDGEHLRVIVYLRAAAQDLAGDLPQGKAARRVAVVQRLQQTASQAQAGLQPLLQQQRSQGRVSFDRSLWIINAIQMAADGDAIAALAAHPDVARVTLDENIQMLEPLMDPGDGRPGLPWHLQRTRVQHAWAGLAISGTGTTIAVMDTGADWQHPALLANYRGLVGGDLPDHEVAWFDAVDGSPAPFDPHGHGTHVVGTAAGRLGVGVAPGSRWMAVRILSPDGSGSLGDVHAGFQWLLAPGGDPSLAPDIVNGSWSIRPDFADFMPDIEALRAAGIIPVFSAGNSGPADGSVRAPANYPGVIAVAATDNIDQVAWFSSRGPSLWTAEVKPTIAAPGVQILSALPGGVYGYFNGTSMASPHIAGMAALVLAADPTLDTGGVTEILTTTARPTGAGAPNFATGWGLADAYSALAEMVPTGRLSVTIRGGGQPLPAAAITITTPANVELPFSPDDDGSFAAPLISGTYGFVASAYGYAPQATSSVAVKTGHEADRLVNLIRLPYGTAEGRLLDVAGGSPLSGTIRVTGAPVAGAVGADGRYALELPVGDYELVAWVRGHLLGRRNVSISAGETASQDIWLEPGPDILLVDSGQWYGGSHVEQYAAALQANDFSYQTVTVRDPIRDSPTAELLAQYDVVVWSAPKDSPGVVGSGGALSAYLDGGGNVLISGQNIAEFDEGPPFPQRWWHQQLRGLYLGKAEAPFILQGEPGTIFEDFTFELAEKDGVGNMLEPDASAPGHSSLTQVGLRYPDGRAASLLAGQCESFRIAYFGFGLESVTGAQDQASLVASAFEYLARPQTEIGLLFGQERLQALVPPGSQRSYPIQILNLSELYTDTFQLSLSEATWPAQIVTDTIELGPCQAATTSLEVDIPAGLERSTSERIEVVARSSVEPAYRQTMTLDFQTSGHILLVDDDRWYDQSATFKAAMSEAGIPFDFWENGKDGGDFSPPDDLLQAYDFVFWYTGYDWFRPITALESQALSAYLAQGGRLFLTSQDYLYYHHQDRLTRDYLGVRHYAESVTPTLAYGAAGPGPFGDIGGPHPLTFGPYQNNGDGLVPAPGAQVSLWHDAGYPAGVAGSGPDWRTVFWAIPLETLPEAAHAQALNSILGWLSDLGQSTFLVSDRTGLPGFPQTYTLTLRYSPAGPGSKVVVTNTLPAQLTIDATSLTGGARYDSANHRLTWSGTMAPGQEHQITYVARPAVYLLPGDLIENRLEIHYQDHDLGFQRAARSWIAAPDLTPSQLTIRPSLVRPGENVEVELALVNDGPASPISAGLRFPAEVRPLTGTLRISAGETRWSDQQLNWTGWLEPGQLITASVVVTTPMSAELDWLPVTAVLEDGMSGPVIVSSWLEIRPYTGYLPLTALNKP